MPRLGLRSCLWCSGAWSGTVSPWDPQVHCRDCSHSEGFQGPWRGYTSTSICLSRRERRP